MSVLDKTIYILIYRTGGIGDVVLSTVSLDLIYKLNQPVKVYWVSFSSTSELIQKSYPKNTSIIISRESNYAENTKEILSKVEKVDLVIDLQKSARSIILCKRVARKFGAKYHTWNKGSLRRSKEVWRAKVSGRRGAFRESILVDNKPRNELMSACVIKALSPYIDEFPENYSPQLPSGDINETLIHVKEKLWIAVAAGGLHDSKRAPESLISGILNKVAEKIEVPIGVVFLGDKGDVEPSSRVRAELSEQFEIICLCDQGTLLNAATILRSCDCLLTNDTALAHIGEAVNVDVATLFGPTVEAFGYSPFRNSSKSFSAKLNCRPCTKDGNTSCRYHDKLCFSLIDADEVANFLLEKLKGRLNAKA